MSTAVPTRRPVPAASSRSVEVEGSGECPGGAAAAGRPADRVAAPRAATSRAVVMERRIGMGRPFLCCQWSVGSYGPDVLLESFEEFR